MVLAGGGGNGAAQAAAAYELIRAGITPDLFIGTSVGSLNAAFLAAHPGVAGAQQLVELWRDGTIATMATAHPRHIAAALLGRQGSLSTSEGIDQVLRDTGLDKARFENLATPLIVGAIDVETTKLMYTSGPGPVAPLLRASAALPIFYKAAEIRGRPFVDAGLIDNCGLFEVVRRLAQDRSGPADIVVLDAAPTPSPTPPKSVWDSLTYFAAVVFRGHRDHGVETAEAAGHRVHVIEVGQGSIADFKHPDLRIRSGLQAGKEWLQQGGAELAAAGLEAGGP